MSICVLVKTLFTDLMDFSQAALDVGTPAVVATRRVFEYITTNQPDAAEGLYPEEDIVGDVRFVDVCFSYPSRPDQVILNKLSLHIPQNTFAALVGTSGGGKSTIFVLLQRFYNASAGQVLVDGRNVRDLNPTYLRRHIGIVPQEPVLFSTSIKANVCYGRTAADFCALPSDGCKKDHTDVNTAITEVMAACELANAKEFVEELEDGYDTNVSKATLSGGQCQRLAIARAILARPQILLLDEATSALDSQSEALVRDALDKAMVGRTVIAIAHRLSTIQHADQILFLSYGQVLAAGRHAELLRDCDDYRVLVEKQNAPQN
jgi:ABC-type multidrug transport system fused ATPase/permease subunit